MAKIDYEKYTLPDIEMYAGNTDTWDIPLYDQDMKPCRYEDLDGYACKLVIKDYGFTHRTNGSTYFTLVKNGEINLAEDGVGAFISFKFTKADTNGKFGKYIYQIEVEGSNSYSSAQGNLYIIKNINQS